MRGRAASGAGLPQSRSGRPARRRRIRHHPVRSDQPCPDRARAAADRRDVEPSACSGMVFASRSAPRSEQHWSAARIAGGSPNCSRKPTKRSMMRRPPAATTSICSATRDTAGRPRRVVLPLDRLVPGRAETKISKTTPCKVRVNPGSRRCCCAIRGRKRPEPDQSPLIRISQWQPEIDSGRNKSELWERRAEENNVR